MTFKPILHKIFKNLQENPCARASFLLTLLKKDIKQRTILMNEKSLCKMVWWTLIISYYKEFFENPVFKFNN